MQIEATIVKLIQICFVKMLWLWIFGEPDFIFDTLRRQYLSSTILRIVLVYQISCVEAVSVSADGSMLTA